MAEQIQFEEVVEEQPVQATGLTGAGPSQKRQMRQTGELPPEEDYTAAAIRYGPPTAAAMIPGVGAGIVAGVGAGSEFLAQKYEEKKRTGDVQWSDLNTNLDDITDAGLAAGREYLGLTVLAPALGWAGDKIINTPFRVLKSLFRPPEAAWTEEGRVTNKVLQSLGRATSATQLTGSEGSQAMFEGMLRNAFFAASRWRQFDQLNEKTVLGALSHYMDDLAGSVPPSQWGENLTQLLVGSAKGYEIGKAGGELGFARAIRTELYDSLRAAGEGTHVSAAEIVDYFKANSRRAEVREVKRQVGHMLEKIKKPPKGAKPPKIYGPQGEIVSRASVPAVDDPLVGTMSLDDMIEFRKALNKILRSNAPDSEKAVAGHILNSYVQPGLTSALESNEAANAALKLADSFLGESADRLENKVMTALYDQMSAAPDAIFQATTSSGSVGAGWFMGKFGPTRLNAVEQAFNSPKWTLLGPKTFEEAVLKPAQTAYFRLAADDMGRIQGRKLERLFRETNMEYTSKVYGEEASKAIQELSVALNLTQNIPPANSVVMQLVQGGMMVRGLQAVASVGLVGGGAAMAGREGALGGATASAAVLFVSPIILTKLLTNPKMIRTITEGVKQGSKSIAFQRAVATLVALHKTEGQELTKISQHGQRAVDFYSRVTPDPWMGQKGPGPEFGATL